MVVIRKIKKKARPVTGAVTRKVEMHFLIDGCRSPKTKKMYSANDYCCLEIHMYFLSDGRVSQVL